MRRLKVVAWPLLALVPDELIKNFFLKDEYLDLSEFIILNFTLAAFKYSYTYQS